MAGLNELVCSEKWGNTGIADCRLIPAYFTGMFLGLSQLSINENDAKDIKSALEALVNEDNYRDRAYPIHYFKNLEDGSEDDTVDEFGYGGSAFVREGMYDWTFRLGKPSLCQQRSLRTFNGKTLYAYFYDAEGRIYGINNQAGDELLMMPLDSFTAQKFTLSDGSGATAFNINVKVQPGYLNDNVSFVDASSQNVMLESIAGIRDVLFQVVSGGGTDTVVLKARGCGNEALEVFENELAATAAWRARKLSDGSPVVVSSVSISAGLATIGLAAPADVEINLQPISVLDGLGVSGYEGHWVISQA